MKLSELLLKTRIYYESLLFDHDINKIVINSKESGTNDIFVAIRGNTNDGHNFISEVINNGTKTIFVEEAYYAKLIYPNINIIKVRDTKKILGIISSCFYDYPSLKVDLTGVTGTNGKTTIASLIHNIYKFINIPASLIGTNGIFLHDKYLPNENTTPNSLVINEILADGNKDNINHVVMEVSSHSVKEQRVGQIAFDTMIYTNFSLDHLDYHKTLDDYFYNKVLSFAYLGNHINDKLALMNGDDEYSDKFIQFVHVNTYTYGLNEPNDFRARNVSCTLNNITFDIFFRDKFLGHVSTNKLFGFYNIYNLLAVLSFFHLKGYDLNLILNKLNNLTKVKGRFEKVETKHPINIFIDFAHTPKGVYKILQEVKLITNKKVIVVIGCGGDRDKTKRPIMGKIATTLADFTIFTSDNPRSENEQAIIDDILKGVVNDNFIAIPNRRLAIDYAVKTASNSDLILILGKGHEEFQIIKGVKYHFSDYEEALLALNNRFMED